jgi:hypothetical protein
MVDDVNQPRIYLYKVTFEEIPDWYWGIHKEKVFGELYLGSPRTHKWKWEFYTPKLQILQLFPLTEEGWKSAMKVESQCIKPDLDNLLCLNEHCGGHISIQARKRGGQTGGESNARNKTGFCGRTLEEMSAQGRKLGEMYGAVNGRRNAENKTGFCGRTPEKMTEDSLKQPREVRVQNGKKSTSQRWQCLETGHISNAGSLSNYQRARGIDTSRRIKIE